ncbi:MAG: AAA family ATPase, partial [Lentisphaerae bacterium]|nr:AAA family ATPase [Lentisphaerota bacterium]
MQHFDDLFSPKRVTEFMKLASVATGIQFVKVKKMLDYEGPLIQKGIVYCCRKDYVKKYHVNKYQLIDAVVDYLSGMMSTPLKGRLIQENLTSRHDLASFNVPESTVSILRSLLMSNAPSNILLYGRPGTGKTEFAKALVASVSKAPAFFRRAASPGAGELRSHYEISNIKAAVNLIECDKNILIVDEADSIINTRYFVFGAGHAPDKSQVNELLDKSTSKIIWITNDINFTEESTLRRFAYSLKFKQFSRTARERIWNNLTCRHPLQKSITQNMIRELAAVYPCNAAGISSALDSLTLVMRNQGNRPS